MVEDVDDRILQGLLEVKGIDKGSEDGINDG
jgi:hypothetical protein